MFNKMLNSKRIIFITIVMFLILIISSHSFAKTVLEFVSNSPYDSPTTRAMEYLAEIVAKRTDGEIRIEVYPNSELGGNREMIEGCSMGSHAMVVQGTQFYKLLMDSDEFYFMRLPFIFESQEHLNNVYKGEIGKSLENKMLEQGNVRLLDWFWDRLPRHLSSQTPIYKVEDLKGQIIRTGGGAIMAGLKWLGAEPVEIPLGEMYMAISQGVAHGADLPLDYFYNMSLYEVNNYVDLVYHTFDVQPVGINEDVFQSLTEEQQKILIEAVHEAGEYNNTLTWEEEEGYIEKLKENGMEPIYSDFQGFFIAMGEYEDKMYEYLPNVPENFYKTIQQYVPSD